MAIYDYPFNERIRSLLRIEDLLQRVIGYLKSNKENDHTFALQSLLQLVDVIDRAEIKLDLIQELNRQHGFMDIVRSKKNHNPEEFVKFTNLINDMDKIIDQLQRDNTKLGQQMRNNEWLMNIKQRYALPGGMCRLDVPSFQHWLAMDAKNRRANLTAWLKPLLPMQQATYILLHLLRHSGEAKDKVAMTGVFHQLLGGSKPAQMLRIELPEDVLYYPEVSANKYAINVRFHQLDDHYKQQQVLDDVHFKLTLCNL